jgi:hypothetical protein
MPLRHHGDITSFPKTTHSVTPYRLVLYDLIWTVFGLTKGAAAARANKNNNNKQVRITTTRG